MFQSRPAVGVQLLNAPRLEIDIKRIEHNTRILVGELQTHGIGVTGVTKASLGRSDIANALLRAGALRLGDSRIENLETMRGAGVTAAMSLIRSPMPSQVHRVVRVADTSFNTEIEVIKQLSLAARSAGRRHNVVLMIELGDLREGLMPIDVETTVRHILRLPNIKLAGLGTNLACRSGVVPNARNMTELSMIVNRVEATFKIKFDIVSGGNSANLDWAMSAENTGRINDLRLGESVLLGREPLNRTPIPGLYTNAITLVAEVIESKLKPTLPTGTLAQSAFGEQSAKIDRGTVAQSILAIGRQDIDLPGLTAPAGIKVLDASSDHLMVTSAHCLRIGTEIAFQIDYSTLLRTMTSPFVHKVLAEAKPRGWGTEKVWREAG